MDIALCVNKDCPRKETCYRQTCFLHKKVSDDDICTMICPILDEHGNCKYYIKSLLKALITDCSTNGRIPEGDK